MRGIGGGARAAYQDYLASRNDADPGLDSEISVVDEDQELCPEHSPEGRTAARKKQSGSGVLGEGLGAVGREFETQGPIAWAAARRRKFPFLCGIEG